MRTIFKESKKFVSSKSWRLWLPSALDFFLPEPKRPPLPTSWTQRPTPLIIGHRGAGNLALENTFAAFHLAIEKKFDGIEMDLQLSKDGSVIVFHDPDLERLTNGAGKVTEKTLAELKQLDAGNKFSEKFVNERIPTFDEVLQLVSGKVVIVAELKSSRVKSDGLERAVVDIIRKHNAFDWVIIDSFNPVALWRIRKLEPKIIIAFDFRDYEPYDHTSIRSVPWLLKQEWFRRGIRKIIKPNFLGPEYSVRSETLSKLTSKRYPMLFWTVNTNEDLKKVLGFTPWGIITDNPNVFSKMIDASGAENHPV